MRRSRVRSYSFLMAKEMDSVRYISVYRDKLCPSSELNFFIVKSDIFLFLLSLTLLFEQPAFLKLTSLSMHAEL